MSMAARTYFLLKRERATQWVRIRNDGGERDAEQVSTRPGLSRGKDSKDCSVQKNIALYSGRMWLTDLNTNGDASISNPRTRGERCSKYIA